MKLLIGVIAIVVFVFATGGVKKATAFIERIENERAIEEARKIEEQRIALFESTYSAPSGCSFPKSALKELECKNTKDEARRRFNVRFNARLAEGWKPNLP